MSATTRRVGVIPELSTASSTGNCESPVWEPKKGLDGQSYGCMTKDVLRDFGSKAWGTPPGQTGGVYPFLGLEISLGHLRNSII